MADWYDDETKKLRAAEEAAAGDVADGSGVSGEGLTSGVRGLENAAKGFYSGSGKKAPAGKKAGAKGGKFGGAKNILKKGGPMAAIAGIIAAVGGLMMGA